MRGDQRLYGTLGEGTDDDDLGSAYGGSKRRKNMRGRKGKYYSQVDDEDQTFLEQERRLLDGGRDQPQGIDEIDEEDDEENEEDFGQNQNLII